jgi:hypothetical protein
MAETAMNRFRIVATMSVDLRCFVKLRCGDARDSARVVTVPECSRSSGPAGAMR